MRFEVRYATGAQHEITLQGTSAVVGRDPTCDLVLNDSRCSRRHAVVEAGPQGLAVRDAGSANGIFVNGRKVDRSPLNPGDIVRLGETQIRVLPEEISGTMVMGPDEATDFEATQEAVVPPEVLSSPPVTPSPAPSPPIPAAPAPKASPPPPVAPPPAPVVAPPAPYATPMAPPAPARAAPAPPRPAAPVPPRAPVVAPERVRPKPPRPAGPYVPAERPLTITVLAVLWLLAGALYGVLGLGLASYDRWAGREAIAAATVGVGLALLSGVLAFGMWAGSPWARLLQLAIAGLGIIVCPVTLPSAAVLVYMLRPEARAHFGDDSQAAKAEPNSGMELAFTATIVGTLLVSLLVTALAAFFLAPSFLRGRDGGGDPSVVSRLRRLAEAEQQFRSASCNQSYASLTALMNPAEAIPNYAPNGPTFLSAEFSQSEAFGYRFEFKASEPVGPSEDCGLRGFRRFEYAAVPVKGAGKRFLIGSDGVVHVADGRPATLTDPEVP